MAKVYCNSNCREGYTADRQEGAIYPAWIFPKARVDNAERRPQVLGHNDKCYVTHYEACKMLHICPYCRSDIK